jgi:hypothetical protein
MYEVLFIPLDNAKDYQNTISFQNEALMQLAKCKKEIAFFI